MKAMARGTEEGASIRAGTNNPAGGLAALPAGGIRAKSSTTEEAVKVDDVRRPIMSASVAAWNAIEESGDRLPRWTFTSLQRRPTNQLDVAPVELVKTPVQLGLLGRSERHSGRVGAQALPQVADEPPYPVCVSSRSKVSGWCTWRAPAHA